MARTARLDPEQVAANRRATLAEMHDVLVEQVASLESVEAWTAWLRFASRFYRYSTTPCSSTRNAPTRQRSQATEHGKRWAATSATGSTASRSIALSWNGSPARTRTATRCATIEVGWFRRCGW